MFIGNPYLLTIFIENLKISSFEEVSVPFCLANFDHC